MRRPKIVFLFLAFGLMRECYVVATTLKQLLTLNCASCEGFSTSGNAFVTSQEHATRTEIAYNLLDGINHLQPFSSFAKHGLHTYTLPPPWWAHVDCQKMGSRLVGQWRRLQKPSMGTRMQGWVANGTQYIFSPKISSHDHACTLTQKPRNSFTGN